ncbi:MAG TPA: hypothetical protein GXX42_07015 [Petrimonas sp.]|nr:hypothetical protein [Petrimonas sp.]MEA5063971.1 hypothetical protein [Petrimonas sp.]HHV85549.1 hypothetical protein [Petrimonas sp.]
MSHLPFTMEFNVTMAREDFSPQANHVQGGGTAFAKQVITRGSGYR